MGWASCKRGYGRGREAALWTGAWGGVLGKSRCKGPGAMLGSISSIKAGCSQREREGRRVRSCPGKS